MVLSTIHQTNGPLLLCPHTQSTCLSNIQAWLLGVGVVKEGILLLLVAAGAGIETFVMQQLKPTCPVRVQTLGATLFLLQLERPFHVHVILSR